MKHRFWEVRATANRERIFAAPGELWLACCEYFHWCEDNPLCEEKLVTFQGNTKREVLHKMRPMTLGALSTFLGVTYETWRLYRNREEFRHTCDAVENIVRTQKFEGAAADMLNPLIIARELGLSDKQTTEISGPDGAPIATAALDKAEYAAVRAQMLEDDDC